MFEGRKLIIATKHEKEKVMAALLEKELGVKCFVSANLDTDILGTFTGEIERTHDPITTARNKCLMAMQLNSCDLAIASEGSFGMHPFMFFVHANEEIVFFIDKKNDVEIFAKELSTQTNFNGEEIKTEEDLKNFCAEVQFPSHGLICRNSKYGFTEIIKGITDWKKLRATFYQFIEKYGSVYIETDMRAMYNPTRMAVIEKLTKKLTDKINSTCVQCSTPGFGITNVKQGLPCSLCGFATQSTLSYIFTCKKCAYTKEQMYPNKITEENPMYCDRCNP